MNNYMIGKPAAKYQIIKTAAARDDNLLNIGWLCDIAGVSRSGYYYWLSTEKSRIDKEQQDEQDFNLILMAFKYRGYDKGARGIHMRLLRLNPPIVMNTKKITRLMKKFNLFCPLRQPNPYRNIEQSESCGQSFSKSVKQGISCLWTSHDIAD